MEITRRGFTAGAIGTAVSGALAAPAMGQAPSPRLAGAIDTVAAFAEAHRRHFGLPGLTLGLTGPGGLNTVLNFGYANADSRSQITPGTLFQIGSISKVMTAALLHQLAAEGRFRLTDRLSDLLPTIPLPKGNRISVQHLLDHVAGLPGDAPIFPDGGLWTAYAPGEHWHYSNTAYDILGKLAEHFGAKPLHRLLEERLFAPLGMRRSRGAILGADRLLYAQGYESANGTIPFARGAPLAPAAWVDVTFGAGSVASTAEDMNLFLRALTDAAQGRGGLGLSPQQAQVFTRHFVPSDTPGMSYGNGLMHVGNAGRSYLHHTGGMVSFSSSFHIDIASGVGSFASSTVSAFLEYRPRVLTRFAADSLTNALAGRPLPSPPPPTAPVANAAQFAGRFSGPSGGFEVRPGSQLAIVADGAEAPLQHWHGDLFRTTHPRFRDYTLKFERTGRTVSGASWGPQGFLRAGSSGTLPRSDPALARLAGRYINDSPWIGAAQVVERGGKLWIGTEIPMVPIGDNLWRVGPEPWTPERASFANPIDGRPQTFIYSGEKFLRHDI